GISDALDAAIGTKADQAELDSHTGNDTIHITASERTKWNNKMGNADDAGNTTVTFSEAPALSNINSGEKTSSIIGKISKAVSTLINHIPSKATGSVFGHVRLSDTYQSAVPDGDAANGMGASQKALADAYSTLNNNFIDSLGGITFGVDGDGNYGYIKAGADTVTPFKMGGKKIGTFSGIYPNLSAATAYYTNLNTYTSSTITLTGEKLPSMNAADYLVVVTGYNADHSSNWAGSTSNGTGASPKIVINNDKTILVQNTGASTINYATDTQFRFYTRARVEGSVYYIGN
ncbi:MAG: hypothetical protein K2I01_03745, partial [Lachnospiraceae bacterium]|nr:hypothetical protein [Lachnospiraceae bacterium]